MTPTQALFKAWCGDGFCFAATKASTFELLFKIQSTNFKSPLQSHIAQRLPVPSHWHRPSNQPGPYKARPREITRPCLRVTSRVLLLAWRLMQQTCARSPCSSASLVSGPCHGVLAHMPDLKNPRPLPATDRRLLLAGRSLQRSKASHVSRPRQLVARIQVASDICAKSTVGRTVLPCSFKLSTADRHTLRYPPQLDKAQCHPSWPEVCCPKRPW